MTNQESKKVKTINKENVVGDNEKIDRKVIERLRASRDRLPDWTYPVVADLATGQVKFGNSNGRWGNPACLDRFLQAYAVERARAEARRRGHTCTEQILPDGSIRLTIQVQGGMA